MNSETQLSTLRMLFERVQFVAPIWLAQVVDSVRVRPLRCLFLT